MGSMGWTDQFLRNKLALCDRSWDTINGELWWLHLLRQDTVSSLQQQTKFCFRAQNLDTQNLNTLNLDPTPVNLVELDK